MKLKFAPHVSTLAPRVRVCLGCPGFSRKGALCRRSGHLAKEHILSGKCPDNRFASSVVDIGVITRTPAAAAPAAPEVFEPVAPSRWPGWAKLLARRRKPGEAGVGDTARRLAGELGEKYKRFRKWIGVPCKCLRRQREWNAKYPYAG